MQYKIKWVRYGALHEEIFAAREEAETLQRFLTGEGFCSQIEEMI